MKHFLFLLFLGYLVKIGRFFSGSLQTHYKIFQIFLLQKFDEISLSIFTLLSNVKTKRQTFLIFCSLLRKPQIYSIPLKMPKPIIHNENKYTKIRVLIQKGFHPIVLPCFPLCAALVDIVVHMIAAHCCLQNSLSDYWKTYEI